MNQTKQTKIQEPKSWKKVESANFFRFEKIGDSIAGLLIEKQINEKMIFYKMKTFDGDEKKFHGSKQLDDLLSQFVAPCYLKITYVDNFETGNYPTPMKVFEVEEGVN